MALIDVSVEAVPEGDGTLAVEVDEITRRMADYHWPRARPFHEAGHLRQTRIGSSIPDKVAAAREHLVAAGIRSPEAARESGSPIDERLASTLRKRRHRSGVQRRLGGDVAGAGPRGARGDPGRPRRGVRGVRFPILLARTQATARGIFSSFAEGTPLWLEPKRYLPHPAVGGRQ